MHQSPGFSPLYVGHADDVYPAMAIKQNQPTISCLPPTPFCPRHNLQTVSDFSSKHLSQLSWLRTCHTCFRVRFKSRWVWSFCPQPSFSQEPTWPSKIIVLALVMLVLVIFIDIALQLSNPIKFNAPARLLTWVYYVTQSSRDKYALDWIIPTRNYSVACSCPTRVYNCTCVYG